MVVGVEGVDRVVGAVGVGVEAEDLVEAAAAVEAADLVGAVAVVEAAAAVVEAADLAAGRRAVVAPWTR